MGDRVNGRPFSPDACAMMRLPEKVSPVGGEQMGGREKRNPALLLHATIKLLNH